MSTKICEAYSESNYQTACLLYTDGLSEALDKSETEYGVERLSKLMSDCVSLAPQALAAACLEDARGFRGGHPRADDLTIMVIQRAD